jgi:hypothetical protein
VGSENGHLIRRGQASVARSPRTVALASTSADVQRRFRIGFVRQPRVVATVSAGAQITVAKDEEQARVPVRGSLSHLSRSDHDAAEIRGDQIRRKSSRRRECHPAPQPAQGDGGKRTIDGRVMSHCPSAHPRLHAPCRRDDVDQALAALRADPLATGFATRPSQSCGGRRQTVAALTSLRFLPRTSTSRSKTPTGLLARSTSGIPRCRKRHDGLQR